MNDDALYSTILEKYPAANKPIKDGGVLKQVYDPETCAEVTRFALKDEKRPSYCYDRGEFKIDIDETIKYIWSVASSRLKDAMHLLANK